MNTLSISQQKTREKILTAARELFYQRGVHAVGVNEIAAQAKASKLSLYRYFPAKEKLVESMLLEHSERIHAWLERSTADAPAGPERVLSVFRLLIDWFATADYHGCAVLNTVTDTRADPAIAAIARNHISRYRRLLEHRLTEAGVDQPSSLAWQLILLIEGASVLATIDPAAAPGESALAAASALLAQS